MNNKDLTLEDFAATPKRIHFQNYPVDTNFLEYPKHYVWEEDGVRYSSWEISPGVFTGDNGKEMFNKAMEEELKNILPYTTTDKNFINGK